MEAAATAIKGADVFLTGGSRGIGKVLVEELSAPRWRTSGGIWRPTYGPLLVTRAFVPILERNGGGRILNVHSARSWPADDITRWVKSQLSADSEALYAQLKK